MTFSNYSVYFINIINIVDIKGKDMKLTAKVQYAYKAILELALRYNNHVPIRINTIAQAQKIPRQFLVQLLIRLRNAGLVRSVRGMEGGYLLARAPSKISLAQVVRALDADVIAHSKQTGADDESGRILMQICDDINTGVIKSLEEKTFDNLISRLKIHDLTYCI